MNTEHADPVLPSDPSVGTRALARQRCLNHPVREAAARCPVCRMFFCRECVVEHEDRVLCSACLRRETHTGDGPGRRWAWLGLAARAAVSFALLWLVFGLLGEGLLRLPDAYHEGVVRGGGAGAGMVLPIPDDE